MHARARVRSAGSVCIEAQYPETSALLVRCVVLFSATLVYQDRDVRSGSGCGILPPCASLCSRSAAHRTLQAQRLKFSSAS